MIAVHKLIWGILCFGGVFVMVAPAHSQQPVDGLRTVDVKRFGITVKAPVAWNLIVWSQDARAFVLRVPQEKKSSEGSVTCELTMAPETLAGIRKRMAAEAEVERQEIHPQRKLTLNRINPLDGKRFGDAKVQRFGERLDTLWEYPVDDMESRHEFTVRMIGGEMLYAFTLRTDQAHFDAYRADFEEMLAGAILVPPETSIRRMSGDLWMQRDFHFALKLPVTWRPAFGSNDKVLFYAVGKPHQKVNDNLVVRAGPAQALDLAKLRDSLPREITTGDPQAVVTAKLIKQGAEPALETLVQTRRDDQDITILERRFRGPKCNYEIKITCSADEFKQQEVEFRKTLDSFIEIAETPPKDPA